MTDNLVMFGMEVEVAANGVRLAAALYDEGLSGTAHLHEYHCGEGSYSSCDVCAPTPDRATPWTAQEDSTVDAEFISKPLVFGTLEADDAIAEFSRLAIRNRVLTYGKTTQYYDTGNHVHVSRAPLGEDGELRLARLFARYSDHLARIAAGHAGTVRIYNTPSAESTREWFLEQSPPRDRYYYDAAGGWLAWKRHTVEFRLWNSTVTEWRLRLHAGLSVAMAQAAIDGKDTSPKDHTTFAHKFGDYMEPDVLGLYLRQLDYIGKES